MKSLFLVLCLSIFGSSFAHAKDETTTPTRQPSQVSCTRSDYDYRSQLEVKKTLTLFRKLINTIQETQDQLSEEQSDSKIVIAVSFIGHTFEFANKILNIKTDGAWLQKDMAVLKEHCSDYYDEAKIKSQIMTGLKSIAPAGMKITFDMP